jgi:hypothetical protein
MIDRMSLVSKRLHPFKVARKWLETRQGRGSKPVKPMARNPFLWLEARA